MTTSHEKWNQVLKKVKERGGTIIGVFVSRQCKTEIFMTKNTLYSTILHMNSCKLIELELHVSCHFFSLILQFEFFVFLVKSEPRTFATVISLFISSQGKHV